MSDNEFFIGYKAKAPPRQARFLRRAVGSLILGGLALAVVLAALQKPFDPGEFEFGVIRDFEGVLLESPVPTLLTSTQPDHSRFLLVAPGKFGATDLVAGMNGRTVHLQGSLIHRGDEAMIEILPGSIREAATPVDRQVSTSIRLGDHTLVGEIVGSKCYLGVMKPGREKTHRACAVRCISGGIPPILRITDSRGEPTHLLLVGRDGRPINKEILPFVAEPVEMTGTLQRHGDQLAFLITPSSIRRLRQPL